jgi:hypothetical protein
MAKGKRMTFRMSMPVRLAAALMFMAGCHGGAGTSVLFSDTSVEEVKAAYIDILTEEVHPSQVDAGFDPIETEIRLDRYCAALKEVAKNSTDKRSHRVKLEDHVSSTNGIRVFDECLPGTFWSNGVCRAQWSRVMDKLPWVGFSRKEQASVSKEDTGCVKLTVWHQQRDSVLASFLGRRAFSWLWSDDPLVEKRRIAAVRKRISRQAKLKRQGGVR